MCSACWQKHPDRPFIRGEHIVERLDDPPPWLRDAVAHLAARHSPARCCSLITALGRLLADEHANRPQPVLDRARLPGRSMGTLARGLADFFTDAGLALPTDQEQRLAAGRRRRRVDAVPLPLRDAVHAFSDHHVRARDRARRAGTLPRADSTIEAALAAVRDLAVYVYQRRGKRDWATVDMHDIEAFLAAHPKMRSRHLTVFRQFFRLARSRRLVLIDPTRGIRAPQRRAFRGRTLTLDQQRALFRRWTTDTSIHPHEALLGVLALLHGASSREVRLLRVGDIHHDQRSVRLGTRPHPVPLDPVSWAVLTRCLVHRAELGTSNPHVLVTRGTKAGTRPASVAYLSHVLDPAGIGPRALRVTRLAELVTTMDAKLVAAAFGMHPEGVTIYLADRVDETRLSRRPPATSTVTPDDGAMPDSAHAGRS